MRVMKRSPWRAIVCSMRRMSTRSVPMPRIMSGRRPICPSWSARIAAARHRGAHQRHGGAEPLKNRVADQEMADIELDDLWQRADRLGGEIIEAMPRMDLEAEPRRPGGTLADALELGRGR